MDTERLSEIQQLMLQISERLNEINPTVSDAFIATKTLVAMMATDLNYDKETFLVDMGITYDMVDDRFNGKLHS